MKYTLEQMERLEAVFPVYAGREWNDPVFWTDWDFTSEYDAKAVLGGGELPKKAKMLAVARAKNENGAPLAAFMLDTERPQKLLGWVAGPGDKPGYWKEREPESYCRLSHFYNEALISAHGADFIMDDADGQKWRQAFAKIRGLGLMERYPIDFLYYDRNACYAGNGYFQSCLMFAYESGTHSFSRRDFDQHGVSGLLKHGHDAIIRVDGDGGFSITDTAGMDPGKLESLVRGMVEELPETPEWKEVALVSNISRYIPDQPKVVWRDISGVGVAAMRKDVFGISGNASIVCAAQDRDTPDFMKEKKPRAAGAKLK